MLIKMRKTDLQRVCVGHLLTAIFTKPCRIKDWKLVRLSSPAPSAERKPETLKMTAKRNTLKNRLDQVLTTLTYREREIIKLLFGLDNGYTYTLKEVALIFKTTPERVDEVANKAIKRLRHPSRILRLIGFPSSLELSTHPVEILEHNELKEFD